MAKKEKKKLAEHDVVIMKKDSTHAKEGEVGTIVFEYESGSFEVEFEDKVVLILPDEIRLYEEVWGTGRKNSGQYRIARAIIC